MANTPVNAYLVEGADGVVAVDATLTVSGGRGLRERAEALGKPLLGVVLTHAHPDHYGGLVELLAAAAPGLRHCARARGRPPRRPGQGADPAPDVRRRVGRRARVPDRGRRRRRDRRVRRHRADRDRPRAVGVARRLDLDADATSRAASSPPTSPTTARTATSPTGSPSSGSRTSRRLRAELPPGTTLHPGHGEPGGLELLDWQQAYIETMLGAIAARRRRRPPTPCAATCRPRSSRS